jgi:hypothetical protein
MRTVCKNAIVDQGEIVYQNLSIAIQNMNSLNISKPGTVQQKKILVSTRDNYDVIFLSDIRLNENRQQHGIDDRKKRFFWAGVLILKKKVLT